MDRRGSETSAKLSGYMLDIMHMLVGVCVRACLCVYVVQKVSCT